MKAQKLLALMGFLGLLAAGSPAVAGELREQKIALDIAAQPLGEALRQFGEQSGLQVVLYSEIGKGLSAPRLSGEFTPGVALERLLRDTGLRFEYLNAQTVAILLRSTEKPEASSGVDGTQAEPAPLRLVDAQKTPDEKAAAQAVERDAGSESQGGVPEILVKGSKILNMDIRRTRDDVLPYVVFDRTTIQRSGATDLNDFLKNRLPMNTVGATETQLTSTFGGSRSTINLRGLGTNQTLILIDGRRASGVNFLGKPSQPDLNGIPLGAIERIEVLPTTASGIYGGSATGGVVNVILRRDYAGTEMELVYDNSFDSDTAQRRAELGTGFSLNGGDTSVLLTASYSDQNPLRYGERDFIQRYREQVIANNPNSAALFGTTVPLGATPNIRSSNGSNLVLRNGNVPLNFPRTFVPAGYPGTAADRGAALLANAGRYNLDLAPGAQVNGGTGASITNNAVVESASATLRHQWNPLVQTFLEGAASNNTARAVRNAIAGPLTISATAPNNPFTQAISVNFGAPSGNTERILTNRVRRVLGGVIVQLPAQWRAEGDYEWNRTRFDFADQDLSARGSTYASSVGNGSLDVLRDLNLFAPDFTPYLQRGQFTPAPLRSTTKSATVRASGPIGRLPGGRPVLTTLVEQRDLELGEGAWFSTPTAYEFYPDRSQSVSSVYAEVVVPLVGSTNSFAGVRELSLQLAGRRDDYSVNGVNGTIRSDTPAPIVRTVKKLHSVDPTVAIQYKPVADVSFRASYGTGFLPPSVEQLVEGPPTPGGTLGTDPLRGNEAVVSDFSEGGSSNLRPEESKSWSAGVVLTPRFLPNLRLSVDHTRIRKSDNITTHPRSFQGYIDDGYVTRAAPAPGDPYGVGRITNVSFILLNLARTHVEAYDVQLDYSLETAAAGTFDFFTLATWQTHYKTQVLSSAPLIENVGIGFNNPLKFKANAGLTWNRGAVTLGWNARYFDSYLVSTTSAMILDQGNGGVVPDQVYHDVFGSYRLGEQLRWISNAEVQLGVRNVFNKAPPLDVASAARPYSVFGDPRMSSYYLSLKLGF